MKFTYVLLMLFLFNAKILDLFFQLINFHIH